MPNEIQNRIENDFTYHPPKDGQNERYEELREKAKELALLANKLCPSSRELSIGFTNLESAVFFFNAAIARNE